MERTNHLRGTRLFVFIILIIIFTIYAYAVLPTVSFSASPLTIKLGESATLSWTSANATSASIDNGIGSVAVNGSRVVKPTKTATYTITVSGSGGSATAKVTVTVIQPVPSVSITATPEKIQEYGSASLAWVSAYATSATIDNSIGAVAINGSKIVTPSKTTTYTITVSGEGGTNSASVTVSLEIKPKCYAYIPNSYDGTVSVIDTLTNQIATTISVGSEPKGVALSPDKTRAYISLRDYVAILDTNTNTLLDKISVPGANKYMAIHANGIFLYIPGSRLENGNWKYFINVIDTGSKAVIREIPVTGNIYGLAVHPDGTRLYACNYSQNKIAVINAATFEALNDIPLRLPWDLVFKPDGSRFYVIQGYDASLENFSVMDAATHSLVAGLRLAQTDGVTATPLALRVHPDGSRVYVTRNDDKFSVIDAASNSVIGTVPIVGQAANAIGVHPDGSRLYIVCTNSNWLRVFNTSGYTAIATVNLGHAPYGLGNFIGFNATTISGKITKSGTGVEGVGVSFNGEQFSKTVQTDAQGNYILAVDKGTYTILPAKNGFVFSPQRIQITANGAIAGQNFTALDTSVPPKINMAASPASVVLGKSATLIWTTTNANSVSLDNAIGAVPVTGSLAVAPSQTTTYTAIATNSVLTASASATVTVTYPLPTVKISAAPTIISPGGTATLTWTSTGATAASMDNGIGSVPVNGSRAVTPAKTTTYKITVTGLGGSASASAAVTIKYPAPTVTFTTSPDAIPPGGSATLTWTTTNATSASIDNGVGTVAINGSKVVSPKIATTYTITVTGQGGTIRASVTVKMLDAVLKAIWNNMKTAMIAGNIDGAASYFSESTKTKYKDLYTAISTQLPQIAQGMAAIEALAYEDNVAAYRIKRKDIIDGLEQEISYRIYFIFENGKWVIYKY